MAKLKDIDKDMIVKIGTDLGCGYLYGGRMGDMPVEEIGEQVYKQEQQMLNNVVSNMYCESKKWGERTERTMRQIWSFLEYIPLMEREVVETFQSQVEPEVTAVLIRGFANGRVAMVDESPRPINLDAISDESAISVLAAIWREEVDVLIKAYEMMMSKKHKRQAEGVAIAYTQEKVLEDAPGIIRKARQIAANNLCFDDTGRMRVQPKKMYESICNKMEMVWEYGIEQTAKTATGKT